MDQVEKEVYKEWLKSKALDMAGCQTALISTRAWIMTTHQGREERLCCALRSTGGLYGTLQMLISVGKSELSSSEALFVWVCVCECVYENALSQITASNTARTITGAVLPLLIKTINKSREVVQR